MRNGYLYLLELSTGDWHYYTRCSEATGRSVEEQSDDQVEYHWFPAL